VTLSAQSLPGAAEPDHPRPDPPDEREPPLPLTMIAVIGVSALVIILCVLGATASGLFGLLDGGEPTAGATPTAGSVLPAPPLADSFGDGQSVVGIDVRPGTYETTVPTDSAGCTWEHATVADGTINAVISTGTAIGGEKLVVTVTRNDEVVRSDGCGTWRRTSS
jgi:hypothetical protein